METQRQKMAVAWLSVASNITLVALKIAVGLVTGAVSVISEAIHSAVDLVASIIALYSVKTAARPADSRHPFGHGKIENISGTVEALLIFLAAGWIVSEAVHKLRHPTPLTAAGWGVGVMLFSAVANTLISRRLLKVGRATDSVALQADGWHLRTDVYTSVGVMVGLGAIVLGRRFAPTQELHWLDPVAALCVALLIIRAAWRLTLQSARDLLDESLPPHELTWIHEMTARLAFPVQGMHDLRTRKAGPFRFVELHLVVDGETSVNEAHRLADEVERAIHVRFPGSRAIVHIDPYDDRPRAAGSET